MLPRPLLAWLLVCLVPQAVFAYPTDEWERTGIRRLKYQYEVDFGDRRGRKMPPGGRWSGKQIVLRMRDIGRDYELTPDTPKDPKLQEALEQVLRKWSWRRYNVAVLDITDPASPRYAGVNDHESQTPGSVAKVLAAAGMLAQLEHRFPDNVAKREELLRNHVVAADDWAKSDSHEVPFIYGDNGEKVAYRKIRSGDAFSLWEWLDHALSASNNSAASTVWREATLMKLLGDDYPPDVYDKQLWGRWDKETMTAASFDVVNEPLTEAGIDPEALRLRLFFTRGANRHIRPKSCGATPFSLIQWMVRVEQGRMVDEFSSLELKKMLYLTRRRVRYFYTKKLDDFGAFFKSGSLYRFSENAERIQYQGDIINVLNALVEVDTTPSSEPVVETIGNAVQTDGTTAQSAAATDSAPATLTSTAPRAETGLGTGPSPAEASDTAKRTGTGPVTEPAEPPYVYIVAVMSNELKRNAAIDHAKLAEAIHEIITAK